MAVFFVFEKLRVVFRVALPLALGIDMLHSFYYVGRLVQEKRSIEAERERRQTLYATGALFKLISRDCNRTDHTFWPTSVRDRVQATPLPDLASLPRPSYELDDDEGEAPASPSLIVYRLPEWTSRRSDPGVEAVLHVAPPQDLTDAVELGESVEIAAEEEPPPGPWDAIDVGQMVEELYKCVVPYPLRHPLRFCEAVRRAVEKELRLHVKKSDGYFEKRGAWLRTALHVPYFMFERRSALRVRVRFVPSP